MARIQSIIKLPTHPQADQLVRVRRSEVFSLLRSKLLVLVRPYWFEFDENCPLRLCNSSILSCAHRRNSLLWLKPACFIACDTLHLQCTSKCMHIYVNLRLALFRSNFQVPGKTFLPWYRTRTNNFGRLTDRECPCPYKVLTLILPAKSPAKFDYLSSPEDQKPEQATLECIHAVL